MYSVDIDTGGTMTDALVCDGLVRHAFKVDTTPHDYSVSFLACLQEAATHLGYASVGTFLRRVRMIRWSSTITTNVIGERRGAKVGLLVAAGHEASLYGPGRSPVVGELVAECNVVGLPLEASAALVLAGVKRLLEGGVRRICVCLEGAFPDSRAERAIKATIEDHYPGHVIGAVPVLLGSDMAPVHHDQTRAHCSLMSAYAHAELAGSLFKAEDLLRDRHGWAGALLIGHTRGGVARIGKTKALDTIESGPVLGTFGGAYMARLYGLRSVLCLDVGGTTTKASVVRDGLPVFQRGGSLMEVPLQSCLAMLRTAVVGGGSVARAEGTSVVLGPASMGSAPGPACYGLGGDEATLTDALLVLGYLDAAAFMGGRRRLDAKLARAAIERRVARPLAVSVELAALAIRDEAVALMAELVDKLLAEAGLAPADTTLFCFGGNGPVFAAFVAQRVGMPVAYAFDLGPVFGAFGSSISDVVHTYEQGLSLHADAAGLAALGPQCEQLQGQAVRDLRGEGFDPEAASGRWQLDCGRGDAPPSCVVAELPLAGSSAGVLVALQRGLAAAALQGEPLLGLRLLSRFPLGSHGMAKRERRVPGEAAARRELRFSGFSQPDCAVYRWEAMNVGDVVVGPAAVNGATLTCPVPPGWLLRVDDYGNAALRRAD